MLRWIFGEEAWGIKPGSTGYRAYEELELQDRRMFREFLLGFAPYAIALISSYALLWEEHILPVHLDLGVTNKFVRPIMVRGWRVCWGLFIVWILAMMTS